MTNASTDNQKLYEGKAKIIYATDDPEVLITYFKDDATAFNAQKKGQITNKGVVNCKITTHLYGLLAQKGVQTHLLETISDREMRVKRVAIVPLEVVVRNIAAGSLCKQTGLPLGTLLEPSLVEFYYKNDDLGDSAADARSHFCHGPGLCPAARPVGCPGPAGQPSTERIFLSAVALPWWTLSWNLA